MHKFQKYYHKSSSEAKWMCVVQSSFDSVKFHSYLLLSSSSVQCMSGVIAAELHRLHRKVCRNLTVTFGELDWKYQNWRAWEARVEEAVAVVVQVFVALHRWWWQVHSPFVRLYLHRSFAVSLLIDAIPLPHYRRAYVKCPTHFRAFAFVFWVTRLQPKGALELQLPHRDAFSFIHGIVWFYVCVLISIKVYTRFHGKMGFCRKEKGEDDDGFALEWSSPNRVEFSADAGTFSLARKPIFARNMMIIIECAREWRKLVISSSIDPYRVVLWVQNKRKSAIKRGQSEVSARRKYQKLSNWIQLITI